MCTPWNMQFLHIRAKNVIYWIYTASSSIRWPISKTNTHSTFFEQLVPGNKAQLQLMNCSSYTFRKKGWGSSEGRSCLPFFVCLFFNNLLLFLFSQRYTMKFTTHNTSLVLLGFWASLLIQYFRLASTFSL